MQLPRAIRERSLLGKAEASDTHTTASMARRRLVHRMSLNRRHAKPRNGPLRGLYWVRGGVMCCGHGTTSEGSDHLDMLVQGPGVSH